MKPADLCESLMNADSEDTVVSILTKAGYWDDPSAWRYIEDAEGNFSQIGNQQSEAVAALVEKIVNGVDARLVNACRVAGIDPESPAAPTSIREAVTLFFEGKDAFIAERDGRIADWTNKQATEQGRLLTVSATGNKPEQGRPCITIADQGEGQTPDNFPNTFLSLMKTNKFRTHFVQGKFNMGGTGALNFCSEKHRLQLIVSRRNPRLLGDGAAERDFQWGYTIVRRQRSEHRGRSSVYAYLAPIRETSADPGGVLSFKADSWPIFPEDPTVKHDGADAYVRLSEYGTLIKLYEYDWQGGKSNIVLSGDGLLRRIDLALPELALPVRFFECRSYRGDVGSFSTNALGLVSRLERDRAENLEEHFPVGATIALEAKQIQVRVYAFPADKAKQYRQSKYGVIFAVNGQMHAAYSTDFFIRKAVNLSYLADSLLVVLNCSEVEEQMREDLFMNSRDRLRDSRLAIGLVQELENYLKNEPALRALQNKRREERTAERLQDDRPLADVLQGLLTANPMLSKLFKHGLRLSAPFPPSNGAGAGRAERFEGKNFPSFFRFKGRASGEMLEREAHLGSRTRLTFETDAADEYFSREDSPGALRVSYRSGEAWVDAPAWTSPGPRSGIAQLWINTLPDDAVLGSKVEYLIEVTDDSRVDAIENRALLTLTQKNENSGGGGGTRDKTANAGKGTSGGEPQLALPPIIPVRESDWEKHGFDESTALRVKLADSTGESEQEVQLYDFYVNVDNRYLKVAQKETKTEVNLLEKQFIYGMVLVGLAMLQEHSRGRDNEHQEAPSQDGAGAEEFVAKATKALAPVFLPMLEAIGGLTLEEA